MIQEHSRATVYGTGSSCFRTLAIGSDLPSKSKGACYREVSRYSGLSCCRSRTTAVRRFSEMYRQADSAGTRTFSHYEMGILLSQTYAAGRGCGGGLSS